MDASIGSLKVALTAVVRQMVLPGAGLTAVTVGGVVSPAPPVLNVQTCWPAAGSTAELPARALPATSVAAVLIVARNALLMARTPAVGVKVADLAAAE